MKILFFGDMATTGFGTVTMDLGRAMIELGADVRFMSQNDIGELPEPYASRTLDAATFIYTVEEGVQDLSPAVADLLAGESTALLSDGTPFGSWQPDAILLLGDFTNTRGMVERYAEAFARVPTFHYVPIEGVDLPPSWAELWRSIQPVAMSKFGQAQIAHLLGVVPPLAYHGVDAETFRPVSVSHPIKVEWVDEEGQEGHRLLGSKEVCKLVWQGFVGIKPDPSRIFVLRTDRNMPRKGYAHLLRAMRPVMEHLPQVDLVIHCDPIDQGGNLFDLRSKLPEGVRERVYFTDAPGMQRETLVSLYNAADIYVSTSSEGFGLTIAEAIACGVPAVGLDYSAVPEVIGPAGQLVPVATLVDNPYDHVWGFPDEAMFGRAVAYLATHPGRRRDMGAAGPSHVRRHFDWVAAAKVFLEVMAGAPAATIKVPVGDEPRMLAEVAA